MPLLRAEFVHRRPRLESVLKHDVSQVLYLPFDRDDGSYARDRSGYVNHGTIYGATRVAGKIGAGLSFDGVDDYVNVSDSDSLDLTTAITLSLWINPNSSAVWKRILDKESAAVPDVYMLCFADSAGKLRARIAGGALDSIGSVPFGSWSHVAVTFDYDADHIIRLYINGVEDNSLDWPSLMQTNVQDLLIGQYTGGSGYNFDGLKDEVRIFNRALSAAEIQRVMNMRGI